MLLWELRAAALAAGVAVGDAAKARKMASAFAADARLAAFSAGVGRERINSATLNPKLKAAWLGEILTTSYLASFDKNENVNGAGERIFLLGRYRAQLASAVEATGRVLFPISADDNECFLAVFGAPGEPTGPLRRQLGLVLDARSGSDAKAAATSLRANSTVDLAYVLPILADITERRRPAAHMPLYTPLRSGCCEK